MIGWGIIAGFIYVILIIPFIGFIEIKFYNIIIMKDVFKPWDDGLRKYYMYGCVTTVILIILIVGIIFIAKGI